jgi:transcription elongation factor GreA
MSKLKEELKDRLAVLKSELGKITKDIETARKEYNNEDVSVTTDLLDKKSIVIEQIVKIEEDLSDTYDKISKSNQTIDIGNSVTLNINGTKREISIVSPVQADPSKGYISTESPLGLALIGKEKGSSVTIETPSGNQSYKVITIE